MLSNFAANSERDAKAIMDTGLFYNLIYLAKERNIDVKKEAIWTISNICSTIQNAELIEELISMSVMHLFQDLLASHDEYGNILILCLTGVEFML
mmetsp:Transcript_8989/g.6753  ORF Transcript_8989/g.6753 Transcript_8989/m.6753 type:complete len:95 (-) Transcript_8989:225-509(-)